MDEKELVKNITNILENKKASNIRIIDLEGLSSLADYFVVCSGRSTTQVKALVDYLDEEMEKLGVLMMRQEGKQEGRKERRREEISWADCGRFSGGSFTSVAGIGPCWSFPFWRLPRYGRFTTFP